MSQVEIEAHAEDAKNRGNDLFKSNDIVGAIVKYSESLRKQLFQLIT